LFTFNDVKIIKNYSNQQKGRKEYKKKARITNRSNWIYSIFIEKLKTKKMKRFIIIIVLVFFYTLIYAQSILYTKEIVSTLASAEYHGRAYYNRADYKAATFIKKEYQNLGLASFENYFQDFSININTSTLVGYTFKFCWTFELNMIETA
jgi:hypothetical protein